MYPSARVSVSSNAFLYRCGVPTTVSALQTPILHNCDCETRDKRSLDDPDIDLSMRCYSESQLETCAMWLRACFFVAFFVMPVAELYGD